MIIIILRCVRRARRVYYVQTVNKYRFPMTVGIVTRRRKNDATIFYTYLFYDVKKIYIHNIKYICTNRKRRSCATPFDVNKHAYGRRPPTLQLAQTYTGVRWRRRRRRFSCCCCCAVASSSSSLVAGSSKRVYRFGAVAASLACVHTRYVVGDDT